MPGTSPPKEAAPSAEGQVCGPEIVYIASPMWFRLRMKGIYLLVGWLLLAPPAQAASVEGEIALPYSISNTAGAAEIKRFGKVVKASCSCRVAEFFGWEAVFAQLTVTNTGSKPMWGQYCLAFYDKDRRLVGTVAQSFIVRSGLKPGKSRTLGPCRIILPRDKYKEIVSYQATICETDKPPTKQKDSILLEDP